MKKKKIGIIKGGVSREREISLRSADNVTAALKAKGYDLVEIDIKSKDCREQIKASNIDVAYNILHGTFGEDGGIQSVLEDLKIPYTGAGVEASINCFDKIKCKEILIANDLLTPEYETPATSASISLTAPVVIKPACEGSSFGISIVHKEEKISDKFNETLNNFPDVFIERFIDGAEVTVGVLKEKNTYTTFSILELVPQNEFYDYDAKYIPGLTHFILPANLSIEATKQTKDLALAAFKVLNCEGAARVDFIVENQEKSYITEINTVPGMTAQSDLPAEAKHDGVSFEDLVERILLTARLKK